MTPADRDSLDAMASALRSHDQAMRQALPILMAGLPQLWSADQLRARWNMGRDQLAAFLAEHAGYRGAPGKPISIPVEVVLRLDAIAKRVHGSVPPTAAQEAA